MWSDSLIAPAFQQRFDGIRQEVEEKVDLNAGTWG